MGGMSQQVDPQQPSLRQLYLQVDQAQPSTTLGHVDETIVGFDPKVAAKNEEDHVADI